MVRRLGWLISWALAAAAMLRDWHRDPFDAALEGTRRYGHNHETALRDGLVATLVELAVLYVLVPSWTARDPVWRSVLALALFVAFLPLAMIGTMHAGGILTIHLLWVLVVVVVLSVLTVARVWRWARERP